MSTLSGQEKLPPVRLKIVKSAFYKPESIPIDKFEPKKHLIYAALVYYAQLGGTFFL